MLQNLDDEKVNLMMIVNEINFLRKLSMCENIVQLEKVYLHATMVNNKKCKCVCLVMKFAKHGSILKHLERKEHFNEE